MPSGLAVGRGCFVCPWAAARPWCCVLLLVAHRCCGCRRALPWGGAALCARGRWPAREIATREPAARSGRSRSPARPRHRPRAPQPGPQGPPAPSTPVGSGCSRVAWCVVSKPGISTITCRSVKCARGNVCEYVLSRPCRRLSNFARNSRLAVSNFELVSLELQRFREVSKNDRDKLRAKFVWRWSCEPVPALRTYAGPANRPQPVPRPGPVVPPAPFALVVPGVPSWLASALPRIRYKTLPAWLLGGESGRKFSLLGVLLSKAVQNSPCVLKVRRIGPFQACWESFVPEVGPCGSCWESFVPDMR